MCIKALFTENIYRNRGALMDKIKEIGIKPLAIVVAVLALLAGVLGIANVGVGAIICGVLAAVAAVLIMLAFGGGRAGSANKSDKYKKLFMNLPIGFAQAKIINDPVNGTSYEIVDANEIFGEYFKLDVSDYKDKILKESKIEVLQDINAWFTAYNNSGTKEGDLMDVEITMESLQKVFNTVMYKSEADYINMVVIDVTKQKETEEKLSKAIVDANAAYKTQAEFLANMSHEIRTPINGILGMLQLTLMAEDLQADYRDNLITAKNCADTLLRLINDILDISKLEAGKYKIKEETFDIRTAIEDTVAAQVPIATNKGLQLDCSFGSNIPKLVRGDGQRIQQVLNCLLSNAIKFTSEGSVRVKIASMDDGENKIKIRMAVADTGIGISAENQRRIFERFIKVDTFQQGTGLGLTISRTIIEALGGKIGVDSEEGVGSTFWFTLPLDTKRTDIELSPDIPVQSEETPRSDRHHSILIAEDVYENYFLLQTLFGKQYQLYHALRARGYRYVRDISSGPNPDGHKNAGYGRIRSDSQNPHLIQDHSDHSAHGIRFRKGKGDRQTM